jgi:putative ribosome biogenesis GTPase RsgA
VSGEIKDDEYFLIEKKISELIDYILIMTTQFPKMEKFRLANKLIELSYDLLEITITINKNYYKSSLPKLDVKHELLRQLINLSFNKKYIDSQKFRVSQLKLDEIGKMIGAWIKREKRKE